MVSAAATVSLTGPLSLQGRQAALALQWWASESGVALALEDDAGSPSTAAGWYARWLENGVDILLGPYGSGLVRRVGPLVTATGAVLWNHGGSADDLARPLVATLPAPASTYLQRAVQLAGEAGMEDILLVVGPGRFASAVASGARSEASRIGLTVRAIRLSTALGADAVSPRSAVLVAGAFEDEVALVPELSRGRPGLIGSVAAGLREFGTRLGPGAEGVLGPVQWLPETAAPEVGPSGASFAREYETTQGIPPDYVAAQAAAAGFLAGEALERGLTPDQIAGWRTSTLLGRFALDASWRQVGHEARTIRWEGGRQLPVE